MAGWLGAVQRAGFGALDKRLARIAPDLPDNAVQRCGASLRATDIVIGAGRVPEHIERPALRAMCDQAAKREPHLDCVDLALARPRGGRAGCGATSL